MATRSIVTAIIGCGKVAETHARALGSLPESRFAAVYDAAPARAEQFAARYGVRAYGGLEQLLASGVEMVSICTPHPGHPALVQACAQAGVHALVEKPLGVELGQVDEALAAARAAGIQVGVVSQRRFYEPVQRVRQAILEGKIGRPALGTLVLLGWRDPSYYAMDPWRGTWDGEGGGVLVNQAAHQLDLFQWLMGPVVALCGQWTNLNHPTIEVEDTAMALLRFRSGALGSIVLSNSQRPGFYGKIHVHGDNGASVGVQTDGGSCFIAGVTQAIDPPVNDIWTVPGEEGLLAAWQAEDRARCDALDPMTHYHRLQIQDFLQAIIAGRPPAVTGDEGRRLVELFTAVYRSQRDGRWVNFPLAAEDGRDDYDGRRPSRPQSTDKEI